MNDSQGNFAQRDPRTVGRIAIDADVLAGKPRVAGTRISVELVLEELSAGASAEQLLDAYPHLTKEDVQACLTYALQSIRHEEIKPLPGAAG